MTEYPCPICRHDCAKEGCVLLLANDCDGINKDVVLCVCGHWRELPTTSPSEE